MRRNGVKELVTGQTLRLQLWRALLAVILLLLLEVSWRAAEDRTQARITAAWQTIALNAHGNTGVLDALEYLNKIETRFCIFQHCLLTIKKRVPLDGVDISGRFLHQVNKNRRRDISRVFLRSLDLQHANLQEANFSGAYLDDAVFSNANMQQARLNEASLVRSDFKGANISHASFFRANLEQADLSRANIVGANLAGSNLFHAKLQGADLRWASLVASDLRGVNLTDAKLNRANLPFTNLSDAILSGSDAHGVDLRWANLRQAHLDGTNLTDANLEGADLSGALFVTQEQLDAARGDADTKIPSSDSEGRALVRPSDWTELGSKPEGRASAPLSGDILNGPLLPAIEDCFRAASSVVGPA